MKYFWAILIIIFAITFKVSNDNYTALLKAETLELESEAKNKYQKIDLKKITIKTKSITNKIFEIGPPIEEPSFESQMTENDDDLGDESYSEVESESESESENESSQEFIESKYAHDQAQKFKPQMKKTDPGMIMEQIEHSRRTPATGPRNEY